MLWLVRSTSEPKKNKESPQSTISIKRDRDVMSMTASYIIQITMTQLPWQGREASAKIGFGVWAASHSFRCILLDKTERGIF